MKLEFIVHCAHDMRSTYSLDVPADASLRCACISGETMFLLATCETAEGLACRLTAFDLARGQVRGSLVLPYIKYDNGGGSLSATRTGDRVAVGSEFNLVVYDIDDGDFCERVRLDTEQEVCTARFLGPNQTVHWRITGFVVTDLQNGEERIGPDLEHLYGMLDRFAVEPDGQHLLAIGETTRHSHGARTYLYRLRLCDLDVVDIYEIDGYVMSSPVVDTRGWAHVVSEGRLIALDLESGECRVLHERLGHAALHGYLTCVRVESDTRLHLVTRDAWLVFDVGDGTLERTQSFARPVLTAGFDAHWRLWTFDVGQVLTQVTPQATSERR